uniref:ATP synthase subunit d, mitochondrial n=1 Tax=Bicosoecida sp. CB-2014 TaxID=1486930 RepID=A0A7S1CHM7_9STRA|mmetsp:Transcript_25121/g.87644  ORF Transcript_25121/g.87644 Transcript_25121/m.87644 type:complete len:212 (+) Transcript_25121:43-678(+)
MQRLATAAVRAGVRVAPRRPVVGVRAFSIDWAQYKAKLAGDNDAVAEAGRMQSHFEDRRAAAKATRDGSVDDIDWDAYAAALPDTDVAALKKDFAALLAAVPDIAYDGSADAAAHGEAEARAAALQALASSRLAELAEVQAEADEYKLHDHYGTSQAYFRHKGLREEIQTEILDRQVFKDMDPLELPAEMSEEGVAELRAELIEKAGITRA